MRSFTAALLFALLMPAAARAEDWPSLARQASANTVTQPNNADAWNVYGYYAYRAGAYPEAEAAYKRSLTIRPPFSIGWNNLGVLYLKTEQYDQAEAAFRKALEIDPANSKAKYNLAVARFRQSAYVDALAMFFDLRSQDKLYADLRSNPAKAEQELDEAIKRDPLNPVLRAAKARFQRYKRDKKEDATWW